MSEAQRGTLIRLREGGRLIWKLRWPSGGRELSMKGDPVFRALVSALQSLGEAEAPVDHVLEVCFTLQHQKLLQVWPASEGTAPPAKPVAAGAPAAASGPSAAAGRAEPGPGPAGTAKPGYRNPATDRPVADQPQHFHNPYNFVPAPEGNPGRFGLDPDPKEGEGFLGHGAPAGHHAYRERAFSGRLKIALEVVTPLIVGDSARADRKDDHLMVDVLTDADGKPVIPITSFKGALRAAYEAITISRMGVFKGHDDKLGRRMGAGEGLAMVPARIAEDGATIELWMGERAPRSDAEFDTARPRLGKDKTGADRWEIPGGLMYAAWLPTYISGPGSNPRGPRLDRDRANIRGGGPADPRHGRPVACWLRRAGKLNREGTRAVFTYWRVEEIVPGHDTSRLSPRAPKTLRSGTHDYAPGDQAIKAVGYVCRTGQNFSRKHDERVFFVPEGARPYRVPAGTVDTDMLKAAWKRLVADYREVAKTTRKARGGAPDEAYLGRDPGKTAFSRHVYEDDALELGPGSLCFARVDRDGKVTGLYPVMIGRELADHAPDHYLPANIRPATSYDALSPADRVFGWVNQEGAAKGNRNMHRGQLRIRSLAFAGHPENRPVSDFSGIVNGKFRGLPLAILSTPKPQQGRFYLARDRNGTPAAYGAGADEAFYKDGPGARNGRPSKALRGRKLFPHHAHTVSLPGYWDGPAAFEAPAQRLAHGGRPYYREYVRQGREGDDQNRSILGWLNPGCRFEAEIDVVNLSKGELGALVWLLSLPDGHVLRMGYGKPLGFGSVRVTLAAADLADGEAIAADYGSLLAPGPVGKGKRYDLETLRNETDGPVAAFEAELARLFGVAAVGDVAVVRAFLNAARGYDDRLPVHYPRAAQADQSPPQVPPNAEGKNFEWFVANVAAGQGRRPQALPPLWAPQGLPYLPQPRGGGR